MKNHFALLSSLLISTLLFSCDSSTPSTSQSENAQVSTVQQNQILKNETISLDVYKDPNCGCCSKWVDHMEDSLFKVNAINTNDLDSIKLQHKIEGKYQSCHTGISQDGYIFEGHVPAKYVKQFLAEKPEGAFGLSVPSMPVGTPGMEVGDKFMPYKILILMKEGDAQVYAEITSAQQQF